MPAKAVKKAKKEIIAMVMEEIKGGEIEAEKPKGNRAVKASETLLALVRGEKRRKAASMINVDLKKRSNGFCPLESRAEECGRPHDPWTVEECTELQAREPEFSAGKQYV